MRLPITINRNTLKAYFKKTQIDKDVIDWDRKIPKTLQELCIETIANNWEENPILDEIPLSIDRCLLLDILPSDLPLKLTVKIINDDIYWKRCYLERWPKLLPLDMPELEIKEIIKIGNTTNHERLHSTDDPKKKWKEQYLQMHIREYLEQLKPENYNAEEMKEISDLFGHYIKILDLRQLQCAENSPNHIPLNSILASFRNLTDLSICFKQTHSGENFTWNTLKTTEQDVNLLAKGLERCNLRVFRLRNSDIDDFKLKQILKALLKNELKTLDFSHCCIGNGGAIALSKFSLENAVEELMLVNNRISSRGGEAIAYAICSSLCNLKTINLKLNSLGKEGGQFLVDALLLGARLTNLCLSACGLDHNNREIGAMLERNSSLISVDLSNNKLGNAIGKSILTGLKYNTILRQLDIRMCQIGPMLEFEIFEILERNSKKRLPPKIIEPVGSFIISHGLENEINNALF